MNRARASGAGMRPGGLPAIPILAYHAIAGEASKPIQPFAVAPRLFAEHLDVLATAGYSALTVSGLVDALHLGGGDLPDRPVVITFDDGYADLHEQALPLLEARRFGGTVYVTTATLTGRREVPGARLAADRMLDWRQVAELPARGVEVGGHTHTHPQLDTIPLPTARDEITTCKRLLEDWLGTAVRSFAYPYGYSTPEVRRAVEEAGYHSACAVRHALSSAADDRYWLPRLEIRRATSPERLAAWLGGEGVRTGGGERLRARAWKLVRLTRAAAERPGPIMAQR